MSELKNIQEQFTNHRKDFGVADLELQQAKARLDKLLAEERKELRTMVGRNRESRKLFYDREKKNLDDEIKRKALNKKSLRERFNDSTHEFLSNLDPVRQISALNDAFPILLFPLRLEVRFKQQQLWLRVYPDDCNINTKEELLSESELSNARSFWLEVWKAGGVEAEQKAAWKSLVNSHGSGRSAWIIQHYKPAGSSPSKPDVSYKILVVWSALVLTDSENGAARHYWSAAWRAKGDTVLIANARNALVAATSTARAAEIIEQYAPFNLNDEVPEGITDEKILLEKIELPEYTATESSWTKAAEAIALPDKFVAVLSNGSAKRTVAFTRAVKDHLPTSVDPSLTGEDQIKKDDDGNLIINEDLQWMTDFDKAVDAGMATKIDLSQQEATSGFEKIFVTGIKFSSNETDGKELLEKLLTDHFYSKNGFGLLRQGTPTNNTGDAAAGYTVSDDPDESFERIFKHREDFSSVEELDKKSDGEKLADNLGIDAALLKLVPHANGMDQAHANSLNTALFPATLGYFMEEMMHPLFSQKDIDATRTFFSNFVSGRGPLPAIRIGGQPYGILPVSVYSRLRFFNEDRSSYLGRLHNLLMKIDQIWDTVVPGVAYIGKPGDPHQVLLDVIGLHATSVEFHQRYSQTIQQLYNQLALQHGSFFATLIAAAIAQRGKVILQELGLPADLELPILEKYFLSQPNLLSGPFVDDTPYSESQSVRAYSTDGSNYIKWLAQSDADTIRIENFGGNPAPTALLYLLLRHALMQAQADAATQLLVDHKIAETKKEFYDAAFIHVQEKAGGRSKFEPLYNAYPVITGSNELKLADHIYKPAVLQNHAAVKRLKETIDALANLEKTSTASLERLFAEHLDCCHYRIDAWKTGLVQYKLSEQRNNNPGGLYLGAYGWLVDVKPADRVLTDVVLTPELNEIFNKGNNNPIQSDSENLGYIHAPSLNQAATAAVLRNGYDSNRSAGNGNPFAIKLDSERVRIADRFLEGMRNGQSLSALLGYQFERGLHDKSSLVSVEVDKFIYPLRKAFPLVADNLTDTMSEPGDSIETIAASNVLDGIKLIKYARNTGIMTYPFGLPASANMPDANPDQFNAINEEFKRMLDIQDAISDLVLSEQVYQVVQGNFERAAGNAEAFSKGTYPPAIDIMETPRTGITLTHRMAIQFDATVVANAGMTPKAKAEPSVNKWINDNLPAAEDILCRVTYSSPVQAEISDVVSLKDLNIFPIDLLSVFNTETEQAMTELDDRIARYVRYTLSQHPQTTIVINYTSVIDETDRTKISFFELGALIKNLRKVLPGSAYLKPAQLIIAQEAPLSDTDHADLKNRVAELKAGLISNQVIIDNIIAATSSIGIITGDFKTQLQAQITDTSTIETLISQYRQDLKNYLVNPAADNKNTILALFENSIAIITDASVITALKNSYETGLDNYAGNFFQLDKLVLDTTDAFLAIALYDNAQTGTGFMQQGVNRVYETVFSKLKLVIERWEQKKTDYDVVMTGYDPAGVAEQQFALLRQAEAIISSTATTPLPADFTIYKTTLIDPLKNLFDDVLDDLKSLLLNTRQKVTDFIDDVEAVVSTIGTHDVVLFDQDGERNDLAAEKIMLALLKEDIAAGLINMQQYLAAKLTACNLHMAEADATMVTEDKVAALLKAAKKILNDEALILPKFTLKGASADEFENSYGSRDSILDFIKTLEGRALPVEDWLSGVARVREKVQCWETAGILANAFQPGTDLGLSPLQFPYIENDRWLAMKFRDETDPADSFSIDHEKLLYTAYFTTAFDKTKPQCGIVIDEWTETIPSGKETTGISFHYDQPGSEPPNTMLLVVPPQITGQWQWEDITDALEETLAMAKKRAVEPSQVEATSYAQFLPTTMMAVTLHWITVATNLAVNNDIYKEINSN